jgi:tRNA(Ile)-lysidine synthase
LKDGKAKTHALILFRPSSLLPRESQDISSMHVNTHESLRQHGVVLAVSGGADSTAMLHWFARFGFDSAAKIAVAHINHGLRGQDSDGDATFVSELARHYQLRYFEHRIEAPEWQQDESGSWESAARQIRYHFLTETAERLGFRYVATAHTADDQTETVLHRIFRGTGLAGLAGIPPFRQLSPAVTLIRPLLNVRRSEILDFLQSIGAAYRTDATNNENDWTRNKIRNLVLPILRSEINGNVDEAVQRLALLSGENETVLNDLTEEVLERHVWKKSANEIILKRQPLLSYRSETLRTLFVHLWKQNGLPLREMGLEQWNRLTDFLQNDSATLQLSGKITVVKETDFVKIVF